MGQGPLCLRSGSDENPGTEARPFATLTRARDAIRVRRSGGANREPVTVFVRQGSYSLQETLPFGKEDSGTATAPIIYRAYQNERPVLHGGRNIQGFTAHGGAILKADVTGSGDCRCGAFAYLCSTADGRSWRDTPTAIPQAVGGGDWAYVDGTRYSMYVDSPDEDNYHAKNGEPRFLAEEHPATHANPVRQAGRRPRSGAIRNRARCPSSRDSTGSISYPRIGSFDPATRQLRVGAWLLLRDSARRPLLRPRCVRGT